MPDDDTALLAAWRGGDRRAGDALIERHYDRIFRFVFKRVGCDPTLTADIVQAVFTAVVRQRDLIEASAQAYLYRIARNMIARRQREAPREPDGLSHSVPDASGESAQRRTHQEDLVARALRTLSNEDQLLLELNRFERMTAREIAQVMGTTTAAINSKLVRAMNKLRTEVRELEGDVAEDASAVRHLDSWIASVHRRFEDTIARIAKPLRGSAKP